MKPEQAAAALLKATWADRGFPVDPAQIAKKLGIDVLETDLPDNVSGALVKKREQDPVILLNAKDSRNRQRFSCAHELGHYIHRTQNDGETYEYIDLRGQMSSTGVDPDEIFANAFAASLLMPEDEVKEFHRKSYPHFLMALHFQVSDDAMLYRLKKLRMTK